MYVLQQYNCGKFFQRYRLLLVCSVYVLWRYMVSDTSSRNISSPHTSLGRLVLKRFDVNIPIRYSTSASLQPTNTADFKRKRREMLRRRRQFDKTYGSSHGTTSQASIPGQRCQHTFDCCSTQQSDGTLDRPTVSVVELAGRSVRHSIVKSMNNDLVVRRLLQHNKQTDGRGGGGWRRWRSGQHEIIEPIVQ